MSDSTFQELWRGVRLYSPDLPVPLAQQFVNMAYTRALRTHMWSQLKGNDEFYLPAAVTDGTVSINVDATAVVGVSTAFDSSMVGRQIMFNSEGVPWYDIVAVTDATHLTLDRAYSGGSNLSGVDYEIAQVYVTCPSDFEHFISVLDPAREWKMHFNVEQPVLDSWDPKRTKIGDCWLLAAAGPSPTADGTKNSYRSRFEVWPRPQDGRRLPFRYRKNVGKLSAAGDVPMWPLKGDILTEGALARLSMYKGTADSPNPYFDLNNYRFHQETFLREVHRALMEDQEVDQTWVSYADTEDWPFAPIDAAYLQKHDISPMTRWGFGYWV